jgi:hypothetical protein
VPFRICLWQPGEKARMRHLDHKHYRAEFLLEGYPIRTVSSVLHDKLGADCAHVQRGES